MFSPILHERDAAVLDGLARSERQRRQRRRRRPASSPRDELRDFGGERAEVVVLGDEVGLAVDLDQRADLLVRRNEERRPRLRPRCGRRLRALAPRLTRSSSSAFVEVAARLRSAPSCTPSCPARCAAQFAHHACGDFRHVVAPCSSSSSEPRARRKFARTRVACRPARTRSKKGAAAPRVASIRPPLRRTSTNSSPACTISWITWLLPSSMASAAPRA